MKSNENSGHHLVFNMKCPPRFLDLQKMIHENTNRIKGMQTDLQNFDLFQSPKPKFVEVKERNYDFLNGNNKIQKSNHSSNTLSLKSPQKLPVFNHNGENNKIPKGKIIKKKTKTKNLIPKTLKSSVKINADEVSNLNTNLNTIETEKYIPTEVNNPSDIKSSLFSTEIGYKQRLANSPRSPQEQIKKSLFNLKIKKKTEVNDNKTNKIDNSNNYYNLTTLNTINDNVNTTATERTLILPKIENSNRLMNSLRVDTGPSEGKKDQYHNLRMKIKKDFPSLFKSCQLLEKNNRQINSDIHFTSLSSERKFADIKNLEHEEENRIYGRIDRPDNVFIYGVNGEGQFLNHNNLVKEGNVFAKINDDFAFNVQHLLLEKDKVKSRPDVIEKNKRIHLKVENLIENMMQMKADMLKN